MRTAIRLAGKGLGSSSPNPSVGCVVVKQGVIVGQGWHEYALRDHAEIRALREAGEHARDSTVYVTLEPCCHQGRTGPCADALIDAGVRRVVIARTDPNPRVSGRGVANLRAAQIDVDLGLMEAEASELIEAFACYVTTGRPLIVSKVGMSLDGRIGTTTGVDRTISCPEARDFGQSLRLKLDALLVGSGTMLDDDPELTYRGATPKGREFLRVILDSRLRLPVSARVFRSAAAAPVLIFCRADASADRRRRLEKCGAEVLPIPHTDRGLAVGSVLEELGKRSVLGLLVEGGSETHWSFISAELVDKFYFIVAPVVLGGRGAIPSVGGEGFASVAEAPRFKMRRQFTRGSDLILEMYPAYSQSILSPWNCQNQLQER